MRPRIGSLFSGSGMLDEGVRAAIGGAVAWHAEVDPAACKVLAYRYPGVPNLGDITAADWSQVEPVDVITGGSPCQDLSTAGKRAGMRAGTRSGLWARMCDAIDYLRPSLVVWENVRGVLSAEADSALEPCAGCVGDGDDGPVLRALGRVLGDLAELGYDAGWHGLRAADVGACHGRFRVFVVATDGSIHGGDHRWRGLHPDRATEARDLLSSDRAHDVIQGAEVASASATDLRRKPGHTEAGRPVGHARRMLVLEDYEREVSRLLAANAAVLGDQAGTRVSGDSVSRSSEGDASSPGTRSALVGHSENARRGRFLADEGAESHWPGAAGPERSVARVATDAERVGRDGWASDARRGTFGRAAATGTGAGVVADTDSGSLARPRATGDGLRVASERRDGPAVDAARDGRDEGWPESARLVGRPDAAERGAVAADADSSGLEGVGRLVPIGRDADRRDRADIAWGQYEPAIRRWERLTRPAPAPTEPGTRGGQRLSPRFTEWMMGWPDGWVTDVPGVSRNDALKICGNGVVPQQAAAAVRELLAHITAAEVAS